MRQCSNTDRQRRQRRRRRRRRRLLTITTQRHIEHIIFATKAHSIFHWHHIALPHIKWMIFTCCLIAFESVSFRFPFDVDERHSLCRTDWLTNWLMFVHSAFYAHCLCFALYLRKLIQMYDVRPFVDSTDLRMFLLFLLIFDLFAYLFVCLLVIQNEKTNKQTKYKKIHCQVNSVVRLMYCIEWFGFCSKKCLFDFDCKMLLFYQ